MPKRIRPSNLNLAGDNCPTPVKKIANNRPSAALSIASSSSTTVRIEETDDKPTQGLRKTNHGVIFQLKLLILFLIRGINAGYMFKLGTEMEDIGGKFDDLIFKYEIDDDSTTGKKRYRYRYLQAKHKQNSALKITAKQLFNDSESDFSLPKYFRSYCNMISRGDDIEDCIICTNISFSENDLSKNNIQLLPVEKMDSIFNFNSDDNNLIPITRYKIKMKSDNKFYRKMLQTDDNSTNSAQRNAAYDSRKKMQIEDFFNKLVFIVNTPNEVDLGKIIYGDVSKFYKLHESDFQSDFILRNMLDWFKAKESTFMSSLNGIEILQKGKEKMKSLRMTAVSMDYQKQLKANLELNPVAIREMADQLIRLLKSSNKINQIFSALTKHTAVKVIAALKELRQRIPCRAVDNATAPEEMKYFQRNDSYLITPFSQFKLKREKFKKAMKSTLISHNLLVVVCEDSSSTESDRYYEKVVKDTSKKVILINAGNCCEGSDGIEDDVKFSDLSYQSKKRLLSREVVFQEVSLSVGALIKRNDESVHELIKYGYPEEIIDLNSMKELMGEIEKVKFPSYSGLGIHPPFCIERRMSFDDTLAKKLGSKIQIKAECRKNLEEAKAEFERTWRIWEEVVISHGNSWELKKLFERRNKSSICTEASKTITISENDLIEEENWKKLMFIISGLAGTGKSTVLSYYYKKIKEEKSDHWVIRMNLADYFKSLPQFNSNQIGQLNAIHFLTNHLPGVKNSYFAQSLLGYRLKSGDRIVIMLDGFDEIDSERQDKVIDLIKSIRLTELNALYITTRSHFNEKLEKQLRYFSFTLENFTEEDQINFLSKYWEDKFEVPATRNGPLWRFVTSLVDRLSKSLKDKERAFIGIPLQCQILAECFESQLSKDNIEKGLNVDTFLQDIDANMNLESLYRRLMKKKREIYRQEKIRSKSHNHLVETHIDDDMKNLKSYLTKLALKTIVSKQEDLDILLGKKRSYQSELRLTKKRQRRSDYGVRFGLLNNTNEQGKMQFLHRTYAEYLMAKYLYQGFHLDEERHNKLLDEKSVRLLIAREILVNPQFNGVQVFFDSMLKGIVQSEKWCNIVHQGLSKDIPTRLKYFAGGFCCQTNFLFPSKNALCVAVKQENATIYKFLNDCFDLLVDKSKVQQMMKSLLATRSELFQYLYMQSSDEFQRYINYFDDTDENDLKNILSSLCECLPPHEMNYFYWNREEQRKIIIIWLELMMKHREFLKHRVILLDENEMYQRKILQFRWVFIVRFFIVNNYYDGQLKLFLELLSYLYNDCFLLDVLESVLRAPENDHLKGKIGKTLAILRDLGRDDVLIKLSRPVLMLDPQAIQNIYPLCLPEVEENLLEEMCWWLPQQNPDVDVYSNMISPLHQAAFQGNAETLGRLLEIVVRKNLYSVSENPKDRETAIKVVNHIIRHDGKFFSPLYLAAACGHEEVCLQILSFITDVQRRDEIFNQDLIAVKVSLQSAMLDTINYKNLETFKLILKAIQRSMGQYNLIELLKSKLTTGNHDSSIFTTCNSRPFLEQIIQVVVQESSTGYDDLNDLVFQDQKAIQLIDIFDGDTLQKMFKAKGLDAWTKRLFDVNITKGFEAMEVCLLEKMNKDQILEFIKTITTTSLTNNTSANDGNSYWAKYIINAKDRLRINHKIMEILSSKLDTNTIKELVLHDDGKIITRAVLKNKKSTVDSLLLHLPKADQDEIGQRVVESASYVMKEALNSSEHKLTSFRDFSLILIFVINHANSKQLSEFFQDIVSLHQTDGEKLRSSIWGHFIQENHNEENVDKFMKCVSEKLGDTFVKDLVIHNDDHGAVIFRAELKGKIRLVDFLLCHLSKEGRAEVDQYLAKHGPDLIQDIFFSPTPSYWAMLDNHSGINILIFFVSYGNSVQLAAFVKVLTSVIFEINEKKCSIWNHLPDLRLTKQDEIHRLFQCISKKLGENILKDLVLSDNGLVVIRLALLWKHKHYVLEGLLDCFSEEKKTEVGKHLAEHLPKIFHETLVDLGPLHKLRWLNILHLVEYTDSSQLLKFIDVTTSVYNLLGKQCSIFRNFFNHSRNYYLPRRLEQINRFMECVSKKLELIDEKAVKKLVYHDEGGGAVILRAAEKGEKLIEKIVAHLNEEDREEVHRFLVSAHTF